MRLTNINVGTMHYFHLLVLRGALLSKQFVMRLIIEKGQYSQNKVHENNNKISVQIIKCKD